MSERSYHGATSLTKYGSHRCSVSQLQWLMYLFSNTSIRGWLRSNTSNQLLATITNTWITIGAGDPRGRKEIVYLTPHATHFIYSYKTGMVLFNSNRGNPLLPHGLLFLISCRGFFLIHHPTYRIAHTTDFVISVVDL